MFSYPISLPWPRPNRTKHLTSNEVREFKKTIESYLNEVAKDSTGEILTYPQVAVATGIDKDVVRNFLYPLTGNTGGITVGNPELEKGTGNR